MKYTNVLIEKEDAAKIEIEPGRSYPLLLDHKADVSNLIGRAEVLREENGELIATIRTFGNRNIKGLFPSVGILILERERPVDSPIPGKFSKGKLVAVGVTEIENQDPAIPPIGDPDKE